MNKKTENSKEDNKEKVAFVKVVEESEATGKVKEIYEDIKKTLGIDFVPNMYKAMANKPEYLDTTWKKIQAIMTKQVKLDSKTKDIVALAVSIMIGYLFKNGALTELIGAMQNLLVGKKFMTSSVAEVLLSD